MAVYDVVVAGLGAMGSSALYHAAKRGLRVLGIEQFDSVPHENGSHHGNTRIIRQAYFEDPGYVPLILRAYELWERLEKENGERLLVKTGGLMFGRRESEVVRGAIRAAQEHNLPYELLTQSQLQKRYPLFRVNHDEVAVFEPEAGYLFSELALRQHVEQAVASGAEVRLGKKIKNWQSSAGYVTVNLDGETIHAEHLILTVGAWAPEFISDIPLEVERQVLLWFQPTLPGLNEIPIFIFEESDGSQFYGFPEISSQGSKVAFHHQGENSTASSLNRTVRPEEIEAMRKALSNRLPALSGGELLRTSACMYTNTPDFNFVVGRHPEYQNVVLGLGYSGHGFKFSSAMGELLVQIAQDDITTDVPAMFQPNRWTHS